MAELEIDLITSTSYALILFKDHKVSQRVKLSCELRSWNRVLIQYSLITFLLSTGYINTEC